MIAKKVYTYDEHGRFKHLLFLFLNGAIFECNRSCKHGMYIIHIALTSEGYVGRLRLHNCVLATVIVYKFLCSERKCEPVLCKILYMCIVCEIVMFLEIKTSKQA